jgi:hypothetical protein
LIHDYGLLNPLAEVRAVKTALFQAGAVIGKALTINKPEEKMAKSNKILVEQY